MHRQRRTATWPQLPSGGRRRAIPTIKPMTARTPVTTHSQIREELDPLLAAEELLDGVMLAGAVAL